MMTDIPSGQVADQLGQFAAELQLDDVPAAVRKRMRLLTLDSMGVALAASDLPEALPVIEHVEELGGCPEAVGIGTGTRVPARSAAYLNGWLGDLLDFEDTQKFGGNHPGATMVPVALAVGDRVGATGRDLLVALIVGYEVANRIARGVFPASTLRGFLTTGATGALGSAATAARLLGLDAEHTAQALKVAGFLLPIAAADTLWEGESAKPAHAAQAAATGIESALLAWRGFTGAPLEGGRRGLGYLSMITDAPDRAAILGGLGTDYTLMDLAFKQYPACGYTNGAIDAAIELHRRLGSRVGSASTVRVTSYHLAAIAVNRHTNPTSSFTACQFSLPYAVAAALLDGGFGVEQLSLERRADPKVHELGQLVEVREDPEMTAQFPQKLSYAVEVVVEGETFRAAVDAPVGTAQNPLSEEQVRAKYRRIVGTVIDDAQAQELEGAIDRMEVLPSLSWPPTRRSSQADGGTRANVRS